VSFDIGLRQPKFSKENERREIVQIENCRVAKADVLGNMRNNIGAAKDYSASDYGWWRR
jgi:hypothetical protein